MSHADRTQGEIKVADEVLVSMDKEQLGGAAEQQLTISSGTITPPNDACQFRITTEGGAASDDLTRIITTNIRDGHVVLTTLDDPAKVVQYVDSGGGAGQLFTLDGENFTQTQVGQFSLWKYKASETAWRELFRSDNTTLMPLLLQLLGATATSSIAIAGGVFTPTGGMHVVTGQGAAADDLDTISDTNLDSGATLMLICGAQDITLKHGVDNVYLRDADDLVMTGDCAVWFRNDGGDFREIERFGFASGGGGNSWILEPISGAFDNDYPTGTLFEIDQSSDRVCSLIASPEDGSKWGFLRTAGTGKLTLNTTGGETIDNNGILDTTLVKPAGGFLILTAVTGGYAVT